MDYEDIEKIFRQESQDKKRNGYGAMKRKATRGKSRKAIKFPSDYLSSKEKKKLNGEIKVYSIYDNLKNVPNKIQDLIKGKSDEEVKNILLHIKNNNKAKDINEHFGITGGTMSYYYYKYGCCVRKDNKTKSKEEIKNLPTWEEIKKLPIEKQFITCLEAKEKYGSSKLIKYWKKSSSTIHSLFTELGIYEAQKKGIKPKVLIENENEIEKIQDVEYVVENDTKNNIKEQIDTLNDIRNEKIDKILNLLTTIVDNKNSAENPAENVFSIKLQGIFDKEELENKLLSLSSIMQDNKKYQFKLSISEKGE